jgi:hypothetical protein
VIEHTNGGSFNTGSVYTRQSNDTVYRYVQSEDYVFLVFNAQLNDVYTTFRTDFDLFSESTCTTLLPVKVLDLDTLSFGTLNLERWLLKDTLFDDIYIGYGPASTWQVVERIGFLNDFPFTLNWNFSGNFCSLASDMGPGYHLTYYSDSSYSYLTPSVCMGNSIYKSDDDLTFKISPNPASAFVNVHYNLPSGTKSAEISLFDYTGKRIYNSQLEQGQGEKTISLADVKQGFYFLSVIGDERIIITQKIAVIR